MARRVVEQSEAAPRRPRRAVGASAPCAGARARPCWSHPRRSAGLFQAPGVSADRLRVPPLLTWLPSSTKSSPSVLRSVLSSVSRCITWRSSSRRSASALRSSWRSDCSVVFCAASWSVERGGDLLELGLQLGLTGCVAHLQLLRERPGARASARCAARPASSPNRALRPSARCAARRRPAAAPAVGPAGSSFAPRPLP